MAMGKLSEKDVKKVARLAKLKLSSEEIKKYRRQLAEVIEYVEELNELETEGVEPVAQTTGLKNVYREDKIGSGVGLKQEEALSGTEKVKNGYFEVEAVIKKGDDFGSSPE